MRNQSKFTGENLNVKKIKKIKLMVKKCSVFLKIGNKFRNKIVEFIFKDKTVIILFYQVRTLLLTFP